MPYDTIVTTYLGAGTHAARPATPNVPSGTLALYYETDTTQLFEWGGSAWGPATRVGVGLASARLAAGNAGALYYATDTGVLSVDDGSAWHTAGGGGGSDATPTATGVVEIDQSPSSGHPIALTVPRLAAPYGLPQLDGDGELPSAYLATPVGSISEIGRWVKHGSAIMSASQSWENSAVGAACVRYDGDLFKAWYEGGWSAPAIGYATSPDGITWTKYASNPIISNAARSCLVIQDDLYILYYAAAGFGAIMRTTSTNGYSGWTTAATALAGTAVAWSDGWANNHVWYNSTANLWYMLVEGRSGTGPWQIALATSSDGLTFTISGSGFLTSLQIVSAGSYSHPWLLSPQKTDGLYHLWYHGTAVSGELPSDIYHATSPDLTTWTILNSNLPVLTRTGEPSGTDQVADPCLLEVDGVSYLFYSDANNTAGSGTQNVALYHGTLHELIAGAGALIRGDANDLVPVANLPVLQASGSSHAAGIAPDPGSTAGTTHFLREDATWQVPTAANQQPISTGAILALGSATIPDLMMNALGDVICG